MIDKDKQYKTRDGREVRIYATDGAAIYPVHGAMENANGEWFARCWTREGKATADNTERSSDLIEVKPRIFVVYWANVYGEGSVYFHESKQKADFAKNCRSGRKACVEITIDCEEGEGL